MYLVRNKINDKIYIGQTTMTAEKRWSYHVGAHSSTSYFHNAVRKYGADSFTITVIHAGFSREELNALEVAAISDYASMNPKIGYNQTQGGEGALGYKHSEEARARHREKWANPAFKDRMSNIRKISQNTTEARKNNSEAQLRPEVVKKKSEATKAQWADPAFAATKSADAKAQWADPVKRERHLAAYNTPEAKAKKSEANRRRWAQPGYKEAFAEKLRLTYEKKKAANKK